MIAMKFAAIKDVEIMRVLLARLSEESSKKFAGDEDLNKIVIKHATAWFILLLLTIGIWRMAGATLATQVAGANTDTTDTASSTYTLPSGANRLQVTVSSISIKKDMDEKSEQIGSVTKGAIVQVVDSKDGWIKIKTVDNVEGYMRPSQDSVRQAP